MVIGILLLLFSSLAFSQQAVTTAAVSGRIEDPSGAVVAGASASIANLDRNQIWTTKSDGQGWYRFGYLPAGAYQLTISHPQFRSITVKMTLSASQALDVPARLGMAGIAQNMSVVSEAPIVESVRTQLAETVLPKEIDTLPVNGRNYLDLALLTPGVSRTNTGAAQLFAETSAVPGTGISVASQRNLNNSFIVDGVSANDDAADLAGAYFSQEVIREFQVISSGGISEFGRASSGVVNITTKSGSNGWNGRLYGFLRNQRLDARNTFAASKDPFTQAQYGASLGGPLRKDRTFLFSNFEQTRQNRAGFITIAPSNVMAINTALDGFRYPGRRIGSGEFSTGYDTLNYFARVDHRLSESNQLAMRYSLYDVSSANARNVGSLNAESRGSRLDNRDQTIAVNDIATLSAHTINEARFQFTRSRLAAPINDTTGPAVNISGIASFGTATFSPLGRNIDLFEASDSLSTQRGAHSLKAGVDFRSNRINILFPGAIQGVYTFSTLADFRLGRYATYQQAFGAPSQFQSNPNLGVFFQDEWRPNANVTVNAGVRYDLQWLPRPINTDYTNVAPRFGISYAPGDRKTVLRASYGLYFDRLPLRATSNALQRDGTKYQVAVLTFGQPSAPAFPSTLPAFPGGLLISTTQIDPNIRNSYSHQANFQIERELSSDTSLSVGYLWLRGLHLIMSTNVNSPTQTGVPNLGRPNLNFANISEYQSEGDSYFNGLTLSLKKRIGRVASLRLSYTLSKSIDDMGVNFFGSPQDNHNIRDDRGLSDNDQRHRVSLSGSFERLPGGIVASYIASYSSAFPFNIQTGDDRNRDTNVNDRPFGVGRNTGRGFNFFSCDARLSRAFRVRERFEIQTLVEGFNLLNRSNFQLPNNIFGTGLVPRPAFGQPTAAADPRQIQIGLRLNF